MIWHMGENLCYHVEGIPLAIGYQARDPTPAGVVIRSSQSVLVDLTRNYLGDNVWAAHEHPPSLLTQYDEVRETCC